MISAMISKSLPYAVSFLGALALTLLTTPIVREVHRRLGMVDKPDPRRINKVPIPRGGGIAIVIGVFVSYTAFVVISGRPPFQSDVMTDAMFWKMSTLAVVVALIGLADDKFSLPPKVKLLGQTAVAALVWGWVGLGFRHLWPALPAPLDFAFTVFWIVGAVNAFNLIDGLDGLASGLALIAVLGMAGALLIVESPQATLFYFAMAGGLVGFLRYNYNPASVFLGDSGSMFLGFIISTLPLASQQPNSFLVSVGVPLLAMGVPIFDTALAILRRSIRRLIRQRDDEENGTGRVMSADADHLHHRILRSVGLSQRKAAWALYAIALAAVTFGLVGMTLRSKTAGLWLVAVTIGAVVIFKNMARIELFDAGRLLGALAHDRTAAARRRWARLAVPVMLLLDVLSLSAVFLLLLWLMGIRIPMVQLRIDLMVHVIATFAFLVYFKAYRTVWSRAMLSNYLRLAFACGFGSVAAGLVCYFSPTIPTHGLVPFTVFYGILSFLAILAVRTVRQVVRDGFYALDCARLAASPDVSRILVYGAGLRYRAFRRELVRTTSANKRMIVGIIDDDILLRGSYIGGICVEGTLREAPDVISRLKVDSVVIACEVTDDWMKVVRATLAPTGVAVTHFTFTEKKV
jgi:UDP-GlcNAc:undecaprenyl-phosphate/decaprenyl-phosphate GlcNAc-1-phosphate transferase